MASIASTGAGDARPACGSHPTPARRACPSVRHQEAGLPDAAVVEAMLAIALPSRYASPDGYVTRARGATFIRYHLMPLEHTWA